MIDITSLKTLWQRWQPRLPGIIGLDLSNERLHLVQFSHGPEGPVLKAAASAPYPGSREDLLAEPGQLKSLLQHTLRTHGFKGRRVVSCMHPSELRFFPMAFTLTEGEDEASALVAELRKRLGASLDQSVVDYMTIRNEDAGPAQREALVVVAPRQRVLDYLSLLEGAGVEVDALDVGPAAVARLVANLNAANSSTQYPNSLTINFGQQRSHLSVIWGRRLMLDREIEFGQQGLVARIARALLIDEPTALRLLLDKGLQSGPRSKSRDTELARTLAEVLRPDLSALVAEVNKTLIYTASRSRGRSVDRVYLLGSAGRYPGFDQLLQQHLAIPVEAVNPFRAFRSEVSEERLPDLEPVAALALACGLALRGANTHA